jgi:hypothetical protein
MKTYEKLYLLTVNQELKRKVKNVGLLRENKDNREEREK